MVEELRTASNKVGLEINLSKIKVMFNRNVEIQPIMTGNVALDQVDRYTYLGQLISIHRDWEPEVRRRVALDLRLASTWSYFGEHGVDTWPENYEHCGGKRQSPVDIEVDAVKENKQLLNDIKFVNYNKVPVTYLIQNNGHTAVMAPTKSNPEVDIVIDDFGTYRFLQLHFHWGSKDSLGSEHTINGEHLPLEMHLVHANPEADDPLAESDGLAVLGVLFKIGKKNKNLQPIIDSLQAIKYNTNETLVKPFALNKILPINRSVYRYMGSLTTPPCSEAVIWSVFTTYVTISEEQVEQFRSLIDVHGEELVDNFRPTQPLNGRVVEKSPASKGARTSTLTEIHTYAITKLTPSVDWIEVLKEIHTYAITKVTPSVDGLKY
ncbi:Carbonic anhydrase [Nymphon striatum]|nr:Carbonic anhydrase [Nymphon striatum]